ncbi:MAG: hypothetical protein D6775_14940 [Caldilineae bacterium]|nr:MAG: hypothetical protein D6775_14940 [Caldilineae bacterium]
MSKQEVRNPYVVGGWVSGPNFYGHLELRRNLLKGVNDYLWVIGTRRVGKTSLLRQLAIEAGSEYAPVYWDLQGCSSEADLNAELYYAVEDERERFADLDVAVETLKGADTRELLREICRAAEAHNVRVLLLVDEPEALIPIAEQDAPAVQRLRAALQRPSNLRVVLSSTKSMARMNDVCRDWLTSSFLHGFAPYYLDGLNPAESAALIRQSQSEKPVDAADEVVAAIQEYTSNHPYLLQWLCYRLYQDDHSLRMPTENDLAPDSMLEALFEHTYAHLSPTEQKILLHLLEADIGDAAGLAKALETVESEVHRYLYALNRLGYTRQADDGRQVLIGNRFFEQWLHSHADELAQAEAEVSDDSAREVATLSRAEEERYWTQQLQNYRTNLARLETEASTYGVYPPAHLQHEIEFHKDKIRELEQRLDALHE